MTRSFILGNVDSEVRAKALERKAKLERGLLSPPQLREKLEEYARSLKLKEASADWYEFFDLASVETGRIPADLQDEKSLRKLPAIFRTLRGQKLIFPDS